MRIVNGNLVVKVTTDNYFKVCYCYFTVSFYYHYFDLCCILLIMIKISLMVRRYSHIMIVEKSDCECFGWGLSCFDRLLFLPIV